MLNQLTIRGMSPELKRKVRAIAQQEGISLNQAVIRLLKKGAGIDPDSRTQIDSVGSSLDPFIGSWSKQQADQMEEALEPFEKIDSSFWS